MIRQTLSGYPYAALACGALVLFFGIFLGATFQVFRKRSQPAQESARWLPLEEA